MQVQLDYSQQFRDFFFKHFEDNYIYAYNAKNAFKFDKDLTLVDKQPCKFERNHFSANWYPTIEYNGQFYAIFDSKLYIMKDFNIQQIADAPNVSGYGYCLFQDCIVAYDAGLAHWYFYDLANPSQFVKVEDPWNRQKIVLSSFQDQIFVCDMNTSDFLVIKSFDKLKLQFQFQIIEQKQKQVLKMIGVVYKSLFFFVQVTETVKKVTLVDVSEMKFYQVNDYMKCFHNTYIHDDVIYSKQGLFQLKEKVMSLGFDLDQWKIRMEVAKILKSSPLVIELQQENKFLREEIEKLKEMFKKNLQKTE
uniref:Uncharacterized protein n=1 Tax=Trepomonas sp. PC1 TaxID=1076344 RepID=A0A146KGV7_9EUKA|eukprot:JAP95368.1 Hypothetical protein TPC1_11667 [Trepomonas sp. PC1]